MITDDPSSEMNTYEVLCEFSGHAPDRTVSVNTVFHLNNCDMDWLMSAVERALEEQHNISEDTGLEHWEFVSNNYRESNSM